MGRIRGACGPPLCAAHCLPSFSRTPSTLLAALQNASLVIIEYSVNDVRGLGLHHPSRGAFETLLRRLRSRPQPPAVLLLHHWW